MSNTKTYDCLIVGSGPAGMSAAIYNARKNISTIILSHDVGGQTAKSWVVDNYLGIPDTTGQELAGKFHDHVKKYNVEIKTGSQIKKIEKQDDFFKANYNGETYHGKTVIIASGKKPRKLNVPGEDEFYHKGVTYCATCDGPLFKDKKVTVVGGGNSALETIIELSKIVESIHVVNIAPDYTGDQLLIEKVKKDQKVTYNGPYEVTSIAGEGMVEEINIKHTESGDEKIIQTQGIFIEVGQNPVVDFVKNLVELNKWNEIKIGKDNSTSVPGVFAAGDVSDVPEKQTIIAAGEGAKAALSVSKFLVNK